MASARIGRPGASSAVLSFMVPGDRDGCVETFGSWDSVVGRSESCGIFSPKVLSLWACLDQGD
jgi:hypothetical protein